MLIRCCLDLFVDCSFDNHMTWVWIEEFRIRVLEETNLIREKQYLEECESIVCSWLTHWSVELVHKRFDVLVSHSFPFSLLLSLSSLPPPLPFIFLSFFLSFFFFWCWKKYSLFPFLGGSFNWLWIILGSGFSSGSGELRLFIVCVKALLHFLRCAWLLPEILSETLLQTLLEILLSCNLNQLNAAIMLRTDLRVAMEAWNCYVISEWIAKCWLYSRFSVELYVRSMSTDCETQTDRFIITDWLIQFHLGWMNFGRCTRTLRDQKLVTSDCIAFGTISMK